MKKLITATVLAMFARGGAARVDAAPTASAHEPLEIALPDPPPHVPPILVEIAPVPAVAVRRREPDGFANRLTLLAGFGGIFMTVDGVASNGMAIQPTLQRTFDRFELQTDLSQCTVRARLVRCVR